MGSAARRLADWVHDELYDRAHELFVEASRLDPEWSPFQDPGPDRGDPLAADFDPFYAQQAAAARQRAGEALGRTSELSGWRGAMARGEPVNTAELDLADAWEYGNALRGRDELTASLRPGAAPWGSES